MRRSRRDDVARERSQRSANEPEDDAASPEPVYLCSEGRPWRQNERGGYDRIDIDSVPNVPDPRCPDSGWRRILGRRVKRKPFDAKNGF